MGDHLVKAKQECAWREEAAQVREAKLGPMTEPNHEVERWNPNAWTQIDGDDDQAKKVRRAAYDRWFHICTCGHEAASHDFSEPNSQTQIEGEGAPVGIVHCDSLLPGACKVKTCGCQGYDHITGKPDHPCNHLPASDPRREDIEAQAKAQALAEVRELQLRLADAYEVIATAVPRDEEGEPDYDKTEAVEEILGGGFFSALEFALTGGLGCLSEEEQAEKREVALREHREVLELSTLKNTQREEALAEMREGLLSDEAKAALYDAHLHYQGTPTQEQSEDGWCAALLEAALSTLEGTQGEGS